MLSINSITKHRFSPVNYKYIPLNVAFTCLVLLKYEIRPMNNL